MPLVTPPRLGEFLFVCVFALAFSGPKLHTKMILVLYAVFGALACSLSRGPGHIYDFVFTSCLHQVPRFGMSKHSVIYFCILLVGAVCCAWPLLQLQQASGSVLLAQSHLSAQFTELGTHVLFFHSMPCVCTLAVMIRTSLSVRNRNSCRGIHWKLIHAAGINI